MMEGIFLFYEKQRRMKHNSSFTCQIPQNYNFFQFVWRKWRCSESFFNTQNAVFKSSFSRFHPLFSLKNPCKQAVFAWKSGENLLWMPALPLDDADQSSLRMIGQLPFTPVHKQLITMPINWLLLWRIWSIHQARRVAILLPYIKAFHQFLC